MPLNELVLADGDTPAVMEAVIKAMIDFRREILDNLKLSLEYHTEQLEEIKYHVEHVIHEQENRMKKENLEIQRILGELLPGSCTQVKTNTTGAFYINPYGNIEKPFMVLCNFDNHFNLGGGWTVFQRRMDGSVDFFRNWTMYKHGFGDVNGEHWLGLEKLHLMTKSGRHELLVLLDDFEGNSTYALYDDFKIGSEEEKYKLIVGNHSRTANDNFSYHNGTKFSTLDQDNDSFDKKSCADEFKGGWWFKSCYIRYSLKSTTMMFRSRS
ncbi:AGAP010774-PA-like protein [Anopheles sinensis]|uniref:AGAP010774-PA-like protein n=1 Tax=Anopheles sinensis TaxID=74873 RepID=A0A084WK17_ANOSI|nr:AGAP010774-PA-like protein [Anopheles sinensis]